MRNHTVTWLWRTPGRKKGYVAALTAVQVLTGFLNVGFALLLRNVINSAVSRDQESFRYYALLLLILTAGSLLLHMVNRWLTELSKAQLENLTAKKVPGVMLIVGSGNKTAIRFYRRHGFRTLISLFGGTVMGRKL